MKRAEFFSPKTVAEVLDLLDAYREKAVIVNGGTDIVEQIAKDAVNPEAIIYIQNVQELKGIHVENAYIRIGGASTYAEVLASPACQQFTALQRAISECGSPPIRAVGTPAGNIGTAAPAADCNVSLIALDAGIVLASKDAERTIAAKDMFIASGRTQRRPNELIKEIHIPVVKPGTGSGFLKLAKRKAQDIAQVSVAVCLSINDKNISDISIALGAVAPTAIKAYSFESLARNKTAQDAAAAVKQEIPTEAALRNPRNKAYKEAVMGVITARAITHAFADAEGRKGQWQ